MSDDQFTKLFNYMQAEFAQIRHDVQGVRTELKADIDRLHELVEQDIKRREVDDHDRLIMNHQLDQHEDWIQRASTELKIKYDRAA